MATQSFTCPNCGAPLEYHDGDPSTIQCPFCSTSVIVPQELRPAQPPQVETVSFSMPAQDTGRARPRNASCLLVVVIAGIVIFILAMVFIPIITTQIATQSFDTVSNQISTQAFSFATAAALPTDTPFAPPTAAPTPTPSFAHSILTFGKTGIGPGLLNDARNIAVDGKGTIYIADYDGGRVQAFDSTGKYLTQWNVGNSKSIIEGLAVTLKGEVFVAYDQYIEGVDGATGKKLSQWTDPNGGEYGDLAVTAVGNVAAAWYEGRWGIITSLDGHRDDLVVYNPQGKVALRVPSFISGQTGDLALDNYIAVDGKGNFYVLSDGVVFKFGPDGKYVNRFGSTGDQPDQFSSPNCIAVDGQGRVFVGDSRKVLAFSPDGRFVGAFPTDVSASQIAFDLKGALWIVSGDKVSEYVLNEK